MITICPRCNQRVVSDNFNKDIVHNCSQATSEVLRNEDVRVIGNASDYDGDTTKNPQDVTRQGIDNNMWGTRAWLDGAKVHSVTSRGNPKSMVRTRTHHEFIDLRENDKN